MAVNRNRLEGLMETDVLKERWAKSRYSFGETFQTVKYKFENCADCIVIERSRDGKVNSATNTFL